MYIQPSYFLQVTFFPPHLTSLPCLYIPFMHTVTSIFSLLFFLPAFLLNISSISISCSPPPLSSLSLFHFPPSCLFLSLLFLLLFRFACDCATERPVENLVREYQVSTSSMQAHPALCQACVYSQANYRIAGFFRGRKLSQISRFCGDLRKFSQRKSIFKQLDTALVGMVHWISANSRKFSLRNSTFKQFAKVFSRKRNLLYGMYIYSLALVPMGP